MVEVNSLYKHGGFNDQEILADKFVSDLQHQIFATQDERPASRTTTTHDIDLFSRPKTLHFQVVTAHIHRSIFFLTNTVTVPSAIGPHTLVYSSENVTTASTNGTHTVYPLNIYNYNSKC